MTDQFPASDFDEWAASYDEDVAAHHSFPFTGYHEILHKIVTISTPQSGANILDLGIGTGNLARIFWESGCHIWGVDFSSKMLALARLKIPNAKLVQLDLRESLPASHDHRFDLIVSAYTFHHFDLGDKVFIIHRLIDQNLCPHGRVVIGDLSFQNETAKEVMRQSLGPSWEEEYYWLADETISAFAATGISCTYEQVSFCAGVYAFHKS